MHQIEQLDTIVEIWKPAAGWEEEYEVSTFGRVRTREHTIVVNTSNNRSYSYTIPKKLKKQAECNTGYLTVALSRKGKTVNVQVHTLVAKTFLPNPYDFNVVNHIDNNGHNNHVENLEWCSHRGNNLHRVWTGFSTQAIPVKCVEDGNMFPSLAECDRFYGFPYGKTSVLIQNDGFDPELKLHFERIPELSFKGSIAEINSKRKLNCNFTE